ncbi:MAG: DoxX family membrane protein [Desulfobacterales bacterium]|jgi:hypothetical protein|nr:DoxX family membrane protein [Desulfobacterales bacterium]
MMGRSPAPDRAPAQHWAYRLTRWGLAAVFLGAGASKLADPAAFAALIDAYGLVPDPVLLPLAVGLPLVEVVAAIGLLADVRGSLAVIAGLMAVFVAILAYGIHMGLDVDCGCFAPGDIESRAYHGLRTALNRDLVMTAGIAFLYAWRRSRSVRLVSAADAWRRLLKWV